MKEDTSFPMLSAVFDIFAISCNFLSGFFLGLIAPVAAISAVVVGIRFLTGQVPFLGGISEDEEGARQLSLVLVSPDQAKELFDEQKDQIGGEIAWMKDEIQAIIEEAKAEAQTAAMEESQESAEEA